MKTDRNSSEAKHLLDENNDERAAARFLGLKHTTLQRWRWAGRGPRFRKFGRAVRYAREDLEAFVAASVRTSTSDVGRALGEPL